MSYQAILFDMDGVLIDTQQSVTDFWQEIAGIHQVHLSAADFSRDIYGCPASHTLDRLFPQLDEGARQAIFDKLGVYEANLSYTPVNGVTPLLQALARHALPTALVTSGDRHKVAQVSGQLNLEGLFQTQVTVDDIQRGKPYPDCYLLAARRLGVRPQQCLVFEDSVSGVKAAVAAGALCVGIRPQETAPALIELGAQRVIPDFSAVAVLAGRRNGHRQLSLYIDAGYLLPLGL